MNNYLDLVLVADTHELHHEILVPNGDVFIHAGDFTMFSKSMSAILDFNEWLGNLPHRHKILIPGNHEFFLEEDPRRRFLISNATVLINEGTEIEGLRIWGSPVTPQAGGAFAITSQSDRVRYWEMMPETDVLITHGPPFGILDHSQDMEHAGDPELLHAMQTRPPRLHVFGHVHGAYGQATVGDTLFANCALLDMAGAATHRPIVLRVPRSSRARRPQKS